MGCKELIDIVLTGAMAFATWQIMNSNANQTKIANQKRKDDLFKIRWKFYQELINFIKNIKFHLDELIYCNQSEKNKRVAPSLGGILQKAYNENHLNLSQDQIHKKVSEIYKSRSENLYIYNDLEIMLALYDVIQGNKSFCEGEVHLKARGFIQKSKYLFGNDVSEFLEQFLSIDRIEEIYQRYYSNMMKSLELDKDILRKIIEIYGWSVDTDMVIRSSRNNFSSINEINKDTLQILKKENTEDLNKLNEVINLLKNESRTFRNLAGLTEDNPHFKELEEKFAKYLKLDN
jgi:hypothetical protein